MGNTNSRYLAPLCAGILLIAQSALGAEKLDWKIDGVDTSAAGASKSAAAICSQATFSAASCKSSHIDAFERLSAAFLSSGTSDAQRAELAKRVLAETVNGVTNWDAAQTAYFGWRVQNPTPPGYIPPFRDPNSTTIRTTCTTTSNHYPFLRSSSVTSTTTCTTTRM
jgi:hypothetical protein